MKLLVLAGDRCEALLSRASSASPADRAICALGPTRRA